MEKFGADLLSEFQNAPPGSTEFGLRFLSRKQLLSLFDAVTKAQLLTLLSELPESELRNLIQIYLNNLRSPGDRVAGEAPTITAESNLASTESEVFATRSHKNIQPRPGLDASQVIPGRQRLRKKRGSFVAYDPEYEEEDEEEQVHSNITMASGAGRARQAALAATSRLTEKKGISWPIDVPQLPYMVRVPNADGSSDLRDISALPPNVSAELILRFEKTYATARSRTDNYCRVCKNPESRLDSTVCLRYYITGRSGEAAKHLERCYTVGGESQKSADDLCLERRTPCAFIVIHERQYAVCFVPVPDVQRESRTWKELHFWVAPGNHQA